MILKESNGIGLLLDSRYGCKASSSESNIRIPNLALILRQDQLAKHTRKATAVVPEGGHMYDFFGTILLIDDLHGRHSYIKAGLERSNYLSAIVHVDSIDLALTHLNVHTFDLIVVRAGLNDEVELGFLQTIKQSKIDTPVLFVTGFGQTTLEYLASSFGATTYRVVNPGDAAPMKLVKAVQATLEQWFKRPRRLRHLHAEDGPEPNGLARTWYAT